MPVAPGGSPSRAKNARHPTKTPCRHDRPGSSNSDRREQAGIAVKDLVRPGDADTMQDAGPGADTCLSAGNSQAIFLSFQRGGRFCRALDVTQNNG
jgi:hypothetical protein